MLNAAIQYTADGYGVQSSNELVTISAACYPMKIINVTLGCDSGVEMCEATHRDNCDLPFSVGVCDLVMSLFFIFCICGSYFVESFWVKQMNESVQTARDYSLLVEDPGENDDDPDIWKEFFSKIKDADGKPCKVRYVTIARRNLSLCKLIAEKHKITRKLIEFSKITHLNALGRVSEKLWLGRYDDVNRELSKAFQEDYPVCKVFVTFELESTQRAYLNALKVPEISAIMDWKGDIDEKFYFHSPGEESANVLYVTQPAEPDDIRWENIEEYPWKRNLMILAGYILVIGAMAATYFIIIYSAKISSNLLAGAITVLDILLGTLFELITEWTSPLTEGEKQSSLQLKLFVVRLLISTVLPYVQTEWNAFLDVDFLSEIITVQLSACFLSPLIDMTDYSGLFSRNFLAPWTSNTQAELNSNWSGTPWSLGERYTVATKILFISLFYAILTPVGLFIGSVSFLLLFVVDRYLLLRKWAPVGLLDSSGN